MSFKFMAKTTQRASCATLLVISYPELFLSINLYCISKTNDVFGSATGATEVYRTRFQSIYSSILKSFKITCNKTLPNLLSVKVGG